MGGLVTIIMPMHNLAHRTLECLSSLAEATDYAPVQLLVIDNGSDTDQWKAVSHFLTEGYALPHRWHRIPTNQGWVGGCNAAYRVMDSRTQWVVLLNNDTIPSQGWLSGLIGGLERHPDYGVLGCVSVGGGGWQHLERLQQRGWISRQIAAPQSPGHLEETAQALRLAHAGQVRPCQMVAFFCAAFPRSVLDDVGFLDPAFGLGLGDDDDLCRRVRASGRKVGIALDVAVWHWHRSTFNLLKAQGLDIANIQALNMAYLKQKGVGMGRKLIYLGNRETGFPYIPDVPARDLEPADMLELAERGWTEEVILTSGLYVPVDDLEVHPFCGALTDNGQPCQRLVAVWGERCWQHEVMEDNDND